MKKRITIIQKSAFMVITIMFILAAMIFSSQAVASNHITIELPTLVIKPCHKTPRALTKGQRKASLIPSRATLYTGPSVICETRGEIRINSPFIVIGTAQSTFGKPWYQVRLLNGSNKTAWLPQKYVRLGQPYSPVPKYVTEDLDQVALVSDINLNVRSCPSTNCQRLTSLNKGESYSAFKKSSNNWYLIEINGQQGWVSGQYAKPIQTAVPNTDSQAVNTESQSVAVNEETKKDESKQPVEVFDPCKETLRVREYSSKQVWRVNRPFQIKAAPHEQCGELTTLNIDQALISTGEVNNQYYQLSFLNTDKTTIQTGYLDKNLFNQQYRPMHPLANDFETYEYKDELIESERYWQSWQYKWDQYKAFYAANPIWATILLVGTILGILYAIPFTRPFARNVVMTTLQAINEIIEWIVGLFLRRKLRVVSSHWHTMIEGLEITPSEFYEELQRVLAEKKLPNARQFEIHHKEGGIFSQKRLYLRVTRKNHAFDICGAPFGNGTFFSWWLGELPTWFFTILYSLPVIFWLGVLLEKLFKPETYYKIDSMLMFQSLVHSAVMEVVDQYTNEKGLNGIEGDDRKPKMKDFFQGKG